MAALTTRDGGPLTLPTITPPDSYSKPNPSRREVAIRRIDPDLAWRVETAIADERQAFARSTASRHTDADVLDVAGGHAIYTGNGLFSNRVFSLGLTTTPSEAELGRIERFYTDRSARTEIEVASVAEPGLLRLLGDRGYRLRRFRNIYARSLHDPISSIPGDTPIETVDHTNRAEWSAVLVAGFGYETSDEIRRVEEWNDALLATPTLTAFLARSGRIAVGSASLLQADSVGLLGGAATRPEHRRRGVQSTLIAARLRRAREAGCDLAVVTADPGGTSARNSERAGFDLVCTHAVMISPPAAVVEAHGPGPVGN